MKNIFILLLSISILPASASVPLKWHVETSRVQPATFEAYQGETLDFEATLQSYGKPLAAPSEYAFYWQTNGMGSAWWVRPCRNGEAVSSPLHTNVLFATWTPDMDVGSKAYTCFIGQTGTVYHAAFQLRLRPSPGATPNELPLPQKVIDFARVTVLNPPWPDSSVTNGLRHIDDLSYVTTAPGGWQPLEVDGHRYDIQYDGYSGWYVEKLTYYPEWGEWYYEDYEFVAGPADAETLTAHKIWSDETITFTRQQVEVTDSLALVSQIGNQAEVAAQRYIQDNDIAKTKTLLRTGKPGEYGTGWGTMHYQFSSDRRWWSIIVPTLTASWSTGGYVDTNGTYVAKSTAYFTGQSTYSYLADPINRRDHTPVARFVSSAGTNGSARCSAATWSVGITAGPGTSSSSVRFDNSADLDAMAFLSTIDVDHADGFSSPVFADRASVPPMEFDINESYYNNNHYVISNFRYGEATVTNRAVSVKCLYDVEVKDSRSTSRSANYTAWCTISLGCSAESYITTNPDYGRVLTDTTRGLYWDSGMRATWRVNVTNGCFFAEIISTNNLAEGVN